MKTIHNTCAVRLALRSYRPIYEPSPANSRKWYDAMDFKLTRMGGSEPSYVMVALNCNWANVAGCIEKSQFELHVKILKCVVTIEGFPGGSFGRKFRNDAWLNDCACVIVNSLLSIVNVYRYISYRPRCIDIIKFCTIQQRLIKWRVRFRMQSHCWGDDKWVLGRTRAPPPLLHWPMRKSASQWHRTFQREGPVKILSDTNLHVV